MSLAICVFFISACSSKKYDARLGSIEKQIAYFTDSYNQTSLKINEIQDTLLVFQNEFESRKEVEENNSKKSKISKKEKPKKEPLFQKEKLDTVSAKEEAPVRKKDAIAEDESGLPVFELGAMHKELKGKPGEIFNLGSGEGYIKIENESKKRKQTKSVSSSVTEGSYESPQSIYDQAYSFYADKKFDEAVKNFSIFLKLFPEHDLSDNAQYWIGESYVAMGEFELALPEFQRIPIQFPNGNKVPDAVLMLGICYEKLNNKDKAKESYERLLSLFPNSMAAKKAKKKLESLNGNPSLIKEGTL